MQALPSLKAIEAVGVPHDNEVAQAVDLGIPAKHLNGLFHVASRERDADLFEHAFQRAAHSCEVVDIFHLQPVANDGTAFGETRYQIAEAFEVEHHLETGQQFARLLRSRLCDGGKDPLVECAVEFVKCFLTAPDSNKRRLRSVDKPIESVGNGLSGDITGGSRKFRNGEPLGLLNESKSWRIHVYR